MSCSIFKTSHLTPLQEDLRKAHAAQAAQHSAPLGAAPAAPLKHPSHGLAKAHMGTGDYQPYPSEAALLEATEEHSPDGFAFAVTHLQAQ